MTKRANLIGKKFGMLTVIDGYHDEEKHQIIWLCKCDCGNNKTVKARGIDLKNGHVKSCTCLKARRLREGESAFNRLYDTYKRRAIQKGISFNLSKERFKEITSKNCFYCGVEPKQKAHATKRIFGDYVYNGVDKIDPHKGYDDSNVVPCCGQCNVAKNNYSYEEFFDWVNRIHQNFSLKDRTYKELENLKIE
jgi:5-methylcytosine-specific restriction endonuclease McrA